MNTASSKSDETETFSHSPIIDPHSLAELRAQMLKFARLQLGDEALAEDTVQEALIGALKNAASFTRQSALKTWVFAILKNKIVDALRKGSRLVEASRLNKENDDDNNLFDRKGFWHKDERPQSWSQPMEAVQNSHFWRVFDACLNNLPANQARLFMMREFLELDSNEISQNLNISTSNLHVMLYRARLRLRECLENNWFNEGETQ